VEALMSAFDDLLPPAARPYSEILLGAGAGALIAHFGRFTSMKRGALYGAGFGLGISLLKPRASWPSFWGYPGRFYAGDSVMQFPTRQMGFVQPYQGIQQQYVQQPQVDVEYVQPELAEEVAPEVAPEWRRPAHDWWRRDRERRGGWGHGWGHGGWGHGWRR
jgi:hypothetical protein